MDTALSNSAYISSFHLNGNTLLFLQRSDPDGILLDEHFRLVTFDSPDDGQRLAADAELAYGGTGARYDLDAALEWCRVPSGTTVDCDAFIGVWNLLNDICLSVPWLFEPFRRGRYNIVYNKLFWGLNLPVFTPEGKHWTPVWRESQVQDIRRVLKRTVFEFRLLLSQDLRV